MFFLVMGLHFKTLQFIILFENKYLSNKSIIIELTFQGKSKCNKEIEKIWPHYKSSLFQHIGTQSSLKGKVQKLKDKHFGQIPQFVPHENPEAKVQTSIEQYSEFSIEEAYKGNNFFWGVQHNIGDNLTFEMTPPVKISSIKIVSGNLERPWDHFYNTTVELLFGSKDSEDFSNNYDILSDNFVVVGWFDVLGVFESDFNFVQEVSQIRLNVHASSENWLLISEIEIRTS